ncbi:hypothetical protein QM012_005794 [Aureobasidium pullulans]|uniref:DUF6594 domain-containing protein n=1 Tax=Aureobasidium pullulans TaxID=5580 RepID=A0ABR0TSD1_AURPU
MSKDLAQKQHSQIPSTLQPHCHRQSRQFLLHPPRHESLLQHYLHTTKPVEKSPSQTELAPTDKRDNQQPQSNVQQRVPFKVSKTGRRLSNTTGTESMLMRRHGPRKVPGDVARPKKSMMDEEPRAHASSTLTTCSEATGISDRSSGSERTLKRDILRPTETKPEMISQQREHQQPTVEGPVTGDRGSFPSPKTTDGPGQQRQASAPQWFGSLTPESIGRPPLLDTDGSTSLPSPQSMRSAYASPESTNPPQARPVMPLSQNSGWTSQQGDDSWGQGPGRPTPVPIRSGASLFQQPGHPLSQPAMNTRAAPLPQTPRSNVGLEDQLEALREHIASQQRPLRPNYGGPLPTPGPYWPQIYPSSPQAQRASFRNDYNQNPRSEPSQAGVSAAAPTASGFPDLDKTTLEGYELLAAKLTNGTIGARPMYRSFEHLHHRLLLYLQDEICEYEEELRNLDEWISQIGLVVSEGKSKPPASRRAEARITPADSELMFRRKFVLGEIFVKLERYHRAVESYCNASKDLQRPQEAEIARYREWMSTHRPVDMKEAAFLEHEKDLLVFPSRIVGVPMTAATACLPLLLLLPFLAFAVMPNLPCRILAIFICTICQWFLCSTMEIRHVLTAREWIFFSSIYVAFMTLIASVSQ